MEEYAYNSQGSYCTIVWMCLGTTMEEYAYNSQGSYYSVDVFGYNNGRVCVQQSGVILYYSVMCLGTTIWLLFMYKGMLLQMKPYKGLRGVFQGWVIHTNNYCGMSCA